MSSNLYDIYRANTLQLGKTLVIKSAGSAEALNRGLLEYRRDVDTTRPESWMYYLNLAGEYHPENTMMTVRSLDTLEEIDFTKENLLKHSTTAREYTLGSSYYKELVRRYPDQRALIRGIITPVDLQTAISAPDHSILYYDDSLVEPWEENLIPELQKFINSFVRRYLHNDFSLVEDLYLASALRQMHFAIPSAIMEIRQKNCRTNYVHSFHLWAYLASHNYLDDYREFLTREQAMWLYRDIRWIDRNNGKDETKSVLIQNVMTKRGFPIGQYNMVASDEDLLTTLYNRASLSFNPLNFQREQEIRHDNKTVREILEKEQPLARDNPDNLEAADVDINFKFSRGLMGEIPTKVLESEVVDISLLTPVRLIDTLYNHWILFASQDVFTSMITVQNPRSGLNMVMSVKDAWVAFNYCLNRAFGVTLTQVPIPEAWDVVRLDRPTFEELRGVAEPYLVSDDLITVAMRAMPSLPKLVSTEGFYLKCVQIRETQLAHRELYSLREHYRARGQMEAVCRKLFQTKRCYFAPKGTLLSSYFRERNWELEGWDADTYMQLATAIFTQATGSDLFYSKSLAEIHAAMLRLFLQLSSYTIHAIQTINQTPAIVADWRVIRLGDIGLYGYGNIRHPWMPSHVKNWNAKSEASVDYGLTEQGTQWSAEVQSNAGIKDSVDLDYSLSGRGEIRIRGRLPTVYIRRAKMVELDAVMATTDLNGLLDWSFTNDGGKVLTTTDLNGLGDLSEKELSSDVTKNRLIGFRPKDVR